MYIRNSFLIFFSFFNLLKQEIKRLSHFMIKNSYKRNYQYLVMKLVCQRKNGTQNLHKGWQPTLDLNS